MKHHETLVRNTKLDMSLRSARSTAWTSNPPRHRFGSQVARGGSVEHHGIFLDPSLRADGFSMCIMCPSIVDMSIIIPLLIITTILMNDGNCESYRHINLVQPQIWHLQHAFHRSETGTIVLRLQFFPMPAFQCVSPALN